MIARILNYEFLSKWAVRVTFFQPLRVRRELGGFMNDLWPIIKDDTQPMVILRCFSPVGMACLAAWDRLLTGLITRGTRNSQVSAEITSRVI